MKVSICDLKLCRVCVRVIVNLLDFDPFFFDLMSLFFNQQVQDSIYDNYKIT